MESRVASESLSMDCRVATVSRVIVTGAVDSGC